MTLIVAGIPSTSLLDIFYTVYYISAVSFEHFAVQRTFKMTVTRLPCLNRRVYKPAYTLKNYENPTGRLARERSASFELIGIPNGMISADILT